MHLDVKSLRGNSGSGGTFFFDLNIRERGGATPQKRNYIYKKGDTSDKNNYRPVSVLPAISKLFEKVLFDQLYSSFLPTFSPNMSGFLRGHSTATALIN